ncbi:SRPBCC family protein, partial [Chloroflexota bacterium]
MITIGEAVTVNVPVDKIFSYVSTPNNLPKFWPSLVEVTDVQSLPKGGYKARYVYKMAGMHFKGTGEYTKIVPDKSLVIVASGGISSVLEWTFRRQASRTRVGLIANYEIPIPLLGKLAEVVVKKMNEQELNFMLANLRTIFTFSHLLDT